MVIWNTDGQVLGKTMAGRSIQFHPLKGVLACATERQIFLLQTLHQETLRKDPLKVPDL